MKYNLMILGTIVIIVVGFAVAYLSITPPGERATMGGMGAGGAAIPLVTGYAEGQEIHFIHTEASDAQVATMLTDMMASPVLVVPSLAQAPPPMVADVYVFTNGVEGDGPFGFQADVFDNPPGTPGYSPLRRLSRVTWIDPQAAWLLTSMEEIQAAEATGALTIDRTEIVVNMPMARWPGGQR